MAAPELLRLRQWFPIGKQVKIFHNREISGDPAEVARVSHAMGAYVKVLAGLDLTALLADRDKLQAAIVALHEEYQADEACDPIRLNALIEQAFAVARPPSEEGR